MPGLCLIATKPNAESSAPLLAEMLARMKHFSWYRGETHQDTGAGIAMGRLSLGFVNAAPQPVWNESRSCVALMDGEIYNHAELRRELIVAGCPIAGESQAETLLHGFAAAGGEFFRRVEGKFVFALWDHSRRRLLIVNDRFGMKPLYFARLPGIFLAASEIKSLLAHADLSRAASPRGLAQFFTFGHLLANDTFLTAVSALPAAACLSYEPLEGRLTIDRYCRPGDAAPAPLASKADFFDRVDAAFARSVDRQTSQTRGLGISLSGGLDSRTILALVDQRRTALKSISLGVKGSLDHRCAQRLAALGSCEHHCYQLDAGMLEHYEQHLRRMVHLTDGHYLDQCIVLPTLPLYRRLGIEVVLRGHAGELMHMDKAYNFSLDDEGWNLRSEAALEDWLRRHLCAYMLDGVEGPLFAQMSRGDMDGLAHESLRECLAESRGVEPPAQRIWHLFVAQRLRRETAMSMAKIGSVVETRLPFLDADFVNLLLAAPPEWKRGDAIQAYILRRHRPEFLKVINANTGAPLGAGPLRQRFSTLRMKVFAKLGVPGYEPYERLGLWLRRELRPLVGELLLSDRCLDRGVFCADTVREVVRNHFEHRKNHTALVLAMMIFEAGQREFIDGDDYSPPLDSAGASSGPAVPVAAR